MKCPRQVKVTVAERVYVRPIQVSSINKRHISFDGCDLHALMTARAAEEVEKHICHAVLKQLKNSTDVSQFEWHRDGIALDEWQPFTLDVKNKIINDDVKLSILLTDFLHFKSDSNLANYFKSKGKNASPIISQMREMLRDSQIVTKVNAVDAKVTPLEKKFIDARIDAACATLQLEMLKLLENKYKSSKWIAERMNRAATRLKEESDTTALRAQRGISKVILGGKGENISQEEIDRLLHVWSVRQFRKFMELRNLDPLTADLPAGSALAAQATFAVLTSKQQLTKIPSIPSTSTALPLVMSLGSDSTCKIMSMFSKSQPTLHLETQILFPKLQDLVDKCTFRAPEYYWLVTMNGMDVPTEDWVALLNIGKLVADAYKQDISNWVDNILFKVN